MVRIGIENRRFVRSPGVTAASWRFVHGRFVVAKYVHHGGMLDENRLEGRNMARDVMREHAQVPLAEETLSRFCQVGAHCPRCCRLPEGTGYGMVLGYWPLDGAERSINGGHLHVNEASWWSQIWPWYLNQDRG